MNQRIINKINDKIRKIDKTLLFLTYLLISISMLFIYSATRDIRILEQNLVFIGMGTFILILSFFIDYRITKSYIKIIYIFSITILLFVNLFGRTILGAKRWIRIMGFQLQPSEFIKILLIMILAYWLVKKFSKGINNLWDIVLGIAPITPMIASILYQPDLGTTMIILFMYFCMIFLYGVNMKPIIVIAITMLVLSVPIYHFVLPDYQKQRVQTFIHPETDITGSGWHITQSKISIGSGGFTGSGILKGSQSRLKFLPEPQTDFIFSVIGEEIGFIGSTFVLLIYFALIYKLIAISRQTIDSYGRLIIYGIVSIFLGHLIVNVGMTIGLVPVTGKPLLFMSYGGSALLSSFMLIGLAESIKIHDE